MIFVNIKGAMFSLNGIVFIVFQEKRKSVYQEKRKRGPRGAMAPLGPPQLRPCLSEQAVTYIQGLFTNYKYNYPDFVRKISDGRISNNNEALHHVLFQMVLGDELLLR